MFEHILGHELIKNYLRAALREERLPQTLLFSGPAGVGRALFAKELAAHLASPFDIHSHAPEGKSGLYAIDTVREMIDQERAAPFGSLGKVFLLEDIERMQPASANALLKTLEEPTPSTTFILLTSALQHILPTILSRCAILHFHPLPAAHIEAQLLARGLPLHLAHLAGGSMGRALELAARPELEEQRKLLFSLLSQRPSYPQMMASIEAIVQLVKIEDDPMASFRNAEHLFAYILMWHRDQHARTHSRSAPLFFPEEPPSEPTPLPKVEKAIESARLAQGRNMKLSHCLQIALNYTTPAQKV